MVWLLFAGVFVLALAVLLALPGRSTGKPRPYISPEEAASKQYPCVYVDNDGSVRELHEEERKYLETPFLPTDGARPYIKFRYTSRNGWGELEGFCRRSAIPKNMPIHAAPKEDPNKALNNKRWVPRPQDKRRDSSDEV